MQTSKVITFTLKDWEPYLSKLPPKLAHKILWDVLYAHFTDEKTVSGRYAIEIRVTEVLDADQ